MNKLHRLWRHADWETRFPLFIGPENDLAGIINPRRTRVALQAARILLQKIAPRPPARRAVLTFDDGPYEGNTQELLEILASEGVPATFFLVGNEAMSNRAATTAIVAAQMEIGSHSQSHPRLSTLSPNEQAQEILAGHQLVEIATGRSLHYFRPPHGECTPAALQAATQAGQTVALWNVDPADYEDVDATTIVDRALAQARDPAVLLLHNGRPQTIKALAHIIRGYKKMGFLFTTLGNLASASRQSVKAFAIASAILASLTLVQASGAAAGLAGSGSVGDGFTAHYYIHAGDVLDIQVYGDQTLSQHVTVLPDGSIDYPLIGRVLLRGLSTDQATRAITHRLQTFIKHPDVAIAVATPAESMILVLGNVKNPGKYLLRSDAHLTDAIAAAGGLAASNGSLPVARISRGTTNIEQVSLQQLFHDGDTTQNVALDDGSVVYIPNPNTFDVEVVGSVDHPGNVTLNEGDRLSMAIAKAGNSQNANADLNHVYLTRVNPNGEAHTMQINLYKTLVAGDIQSDIPMQKGDIVYIPIAKGNGRPSNTTGNALLLLGRLVGLPTY